MKRIFIMAVFSLLLTSIVYADNVTYSCTRIDDDGSTYYLDRKLAERRANADKHTDDEITDLMINLMNTLVRYKNSYRPITYAYRVMNSLLDIVKNTFVELNK